MYYNGNVKVSVSNLYKPLVNQIFHSLKLRHRLQLITTINRSLYVIRPFQQKSRILTISWFLLLMRNK